MIRFLCLFLLLCFLPAPVIAQDKIDLSEWSSLPILHGGRVKPLDSFARIHLKIFAQKTHIDGLNAAEWLAESVFTPNIAITRPIFKIRKAEKYGLSEIKNKLYNYVDLSVLVQNREDVIKNLIARSAEEWTPEQKELMTQYENFILYTQILRSLTLVLPLNINLPDQISADQKPTNFLEYESFQKNIEVRVKKIIKHKGTDPEKYTAEEKEMAAISYQLQILKKSGQQNVLFRIIPQGNEWVAPWAATENTKILKKWQNLADSYRNKNATLWRSTLAELQSPDAKTKLKTEVFYNILHLLIVAGILYAVSFLLLVFTNFMNNNELIKYTIKYSFMALLGGLTAHTIHIALRIYILDRPPVGTLYESILFVSLICVAGAVFLEWKQKNSTGILLGSLSGVLLLTTATAFASEDTMSMLVAVLNTNFWLTIHVLCITIGYGWCLIAAFLAHIYLVQRLRQPNETKILNSLQRNLKTLVILSLLFTAIGTILGGIWADQSWGRFWGWDPKENGALLIVLWLIWLLHGRISKHLTEIGFIIGTAFLSVIVILAWFGVNLLSVGLHSYGFISGIAWGIGLFCLAETLLIGGLGFSLYRKESSSRGTG